MDAAASHEADGASIITLEDPPPAYEDLSRPVSILTDYTDVTLTDNPQPISSRPFPVRFNLYYQKADWKTTSFYLGEHAEQPCNAVTLKSAWRGTSLALHETADPASSVLAIASAEFAWSRQSVLTLPAQPNSGEEDIVEPLHLHAALTSMRFSFSIRIPVQGDKPRVEKFEWRITHGNEVRDLDKRSWGWKLVRVDKDSGSVKQGGKRRERDVGETSDGKELVAVCADYNTSRNKVGKFQFVGSGATGELGNNWAVMAVTSILRIWQNVRLGSTGGGVASGSASSSSSSSVPSTS